MYHIEVGKDKPDIKRLESNVKAMMERGVKIGEVREFRNQLENTLEEIKRELNEEYGIENPSSPKQITDFLERESRKVPYGCKNDYIENCYIDKKWVTGAEVMNKMSLLGYNFADLILKFRTTKKNCEMLDSLTKVTDEKGRIHPTVTLTRTNRVSYSAPALMSIRKQLLWYVVKPLEKGDKLYSVDVKNQEPAILINALGDENLIESLKADEGLYESLFKYVFRPFTVMTLLEDTLMEDRIYSADELKDNVLVPTEAYMPMRAPTMSWFMDGKRVVAVQRVCQGVSEESIIEYPDEVLVELEDGSVERLKVKWDEENKTKSKGATLVNGYLDGVEMRISKQERSEFKTSFIAISYNASAMRVKSICQIIDGNIVYNRIAKLKKMLDYRKNCGKAASAGIKQLQTIFGTPVFGKDTNDVNELKRSLTSVPIQGTGADILDLLINHFNEEVGKVFTDCELPFIYYTRHDELIIEVPEGTYGKYGKEFIDNWLMETMTHQVGTWVPFKIEVTLLEDLDLNTLVDNSAYES